VGFDFFGVDVFTFETSLRMTPVLAQLNWHLTPGHKVDLYVSPIAGWVRYGDLNVRLRGAAVDGGEVLVDHVQTKDGFTWGGRIGFDVPFGERGLFFTAAATYLKATVKPDVSAIDPESESQPENFDLDPFIVQAGFGYRF
jgi:outer membrane protein W